MIVKPTLNLNYYSGTDFYSEGAIEDTIVNIIRENEPESYEDAIYSNYSWSTYYHLTHVRRSILSWYPFIKGDVLEIGAGFGAITGLLCEKCSHVTAVELSKRRAEGCLYRNRDKENLEIIVGNLNDIKFDRKFDYITLIGVLEYQGEYTESEGNPYLDFLTQIKQLLKPEGRLLIAIENQFGIKYWCGSFEDHTGYPFDGINGYRNSSKKVRTFSREALDKLVRSAGFCNTFFYYPMPDYKLPSVIYSDKKLPQKDDFNSQFFYNIPTTHTLVANEKNVLNDIIENNVFPFFANSFLVECSASPEATLGEVSYASIVSDRMDEFRVITGIRDNTVEKMPCSERSLSHLQTILNNEDRMLNAGLSFIQSEVKDGTILVTEKVDLPSFESLLVDCITNENEDELFRLSDMWLDDIVRSGEAVSPADNLVYELCPDAVHDDELFGPVLSYALIDMIPRNAFWSDNTLIWFDQEWGLEHVPAKFVLFRGIKEMYLLHPELNGHISLNRYLEHYSIDKLFSSFASLEKLFIQTVIDRTAQSERCSLPSFDEKECTDTLSRLFKK